MFKSSHLDRILVPCPECGADAKYIKPSMLEIITGRRKPRKNNFKCRRCKLEFRIQF